MGYVITERNNLSSDYRKYIVMNKSNHSYAQNNKITSIYNENSWSNKRCFIIGGGESLKGFDFNLLNNELTIGINKSFSNYNPTFNYSMDVTFYDLMQKGGYDRPEEKKLWEKWLEFKGVRVFLTPMNIKKFGDEVFLIRRELRSSLNREDLDRGIWGGSHSGMGAINLAIALGSTEVYLLGYDFIVKENTHWHSGYEKNRDIVQFGLKLKKYREEIEKISSQIKESGIVVYNCNSNSELKCFPFVDIQRVLCTTQQ
jgi:hypothetical protein